MPSPKQYFIKKRWELTKIATTTTNKNYYKARNQKFWP